MCCDHSNTHKCRCTLFPIAEVESLQISQPPPGAMNSNRFPQREDRQTLGLAEKPGLYSGVRLFENIIEQEARRVADGEKQKGVLEDSAIVEVGSTKALRGLTGSFESHSENDRFLALLEKLRGSNSYRFKDLLGKYKDPVTGCSYPVGTSQEQFQQQLRYAHFFRETFEHCFPGPEPLKRFFAAWKADEFEGRRLHSAALDILFYEALSMGQDGSKDSGVDMEMPVRMGASELNPKAREFFSMSFMPDPSKLSQRSALKPKQLLIREQAAAPPREVPCPPAPPSHAPLPNLPNPSLPLPMAATCPGILPGPPSLSNTGNVAPVLPQFPFPMGAKMPSLAPPPTFANLLAFPPLGIPSPSSLSQTAFSYLAPLYLPSAIGTQATAPSNINLTPIPQFPLGQPPKKPKVPDTHAQQQYEYWVEMRKAMDPAYALECKARQARRAARQARGINRRYQGNTNSTHTSVTQSSVAPSQPPHVERVCQKSYFTRSAPASSIY